MSDFLKSLLDKNPGSQTGELIGAYLSGRDKKDNRARNVLIASLFFNAKEAAMQSKVRKQLEELERNKTLEVAKLNNQWTKRVNLSNQYENIQKKGALNYYRADAEQAFNDAHSQEKELMSLQGGDIANYKLKWMTKYANTQNDEFMKQYNNIDKSITTKEEFTKPYMDYYRAQQEQIAAPANVSLVHKAFGAIGIGKDKQEYADKVEELKGRRQANQKRILTYTAEDVARIQQERGDVEGLKISGADLNTLLNNSGLNESDQDSLRLRRGVREQWRANNMTYQAAQDAIAAYEEGFNTKINLLKLDDAEARYKEYSPEPENKDSIEYQSWERGLNKAKRTALGIEDLSQDTIDKANTIFDLTAMIDENKNNGKSTEVLERERQEFIEDYIAEIQRKAVGGVDMATVKAEIVASRMAVVYGMIDDNPSLTNDIQLSAIDITSLPVEVQTAIEGKSIEEINQNQTLLGDSKQLFRNLQQQAYVTQQYNIAIAFANDIDDENSNPLGIKL
jgi:hypothetical protein